MRKVKLKNLISKRDTGMIEISEEGYWIEIGVLGVDMEDNNNFLDKIVEI